LTDAHLHYFSINQLADGSWRTTSYRPPEEYGPFTTTAVVLRAIKLYPIPGRRQEFQDRVARARRWLLSAKASSQEERSMQLNATSRCWRQFFGTCAFHKGVESRSEPRWKLERTSRYPGWKLMLQAKVFMPYMYTERVPTTDAVYKLGVQWLLRNQLADGSGFMPTRAVPVQPHTFESGFPHGWHQFASAGASSWATMALLFALPDIPRAAASR